MLEAIGSIEEANGDKCCCDSCGMAGLAPKLHFESMKPISTAGHKRRAAAYRVTDDLLVELKRSLRGETSICTAIQVTSCLDQTVSVLTV